MQLMRSAAAPCSLAAALLRGFASSSTSSSTTCAIRRHAVLAALSSSSFSPATTRFAAWSSPPRGSRGRGFSAWASTPGSAGSADSPAMQALEAKVEVICFSSAAVGSWQIKEQLEADTVAVVDTSGDGRHVW
ncbi:hypothetical protein GUJ93_ZPchr0012g20611 [Zizania palustris]|uniref:Uncharacterized protein n=1 Tax=Zizania palustris TaxID=103762 RepID=A0A8J5WNN4_ZIZPA|nr:hypothetical protein GUJ93_ZPchr0012g20611 [Zizania palustris]